MQLEQAALKDDYFVTRHALCACPRLSCPASKQSLGCTRLSLCFMCSGSAQAPC